MFKAEVQQTVYEERYSVAINRVRMEIKYSVATKTGLFGKSICYLSVGLYIWKNDTAVSEE